MNEPALPKGTLLGKYRVERLLDRGGMGEVYEGWDESLRRRVALKVLPPALVGRPDRVERLIKEARNASAFNHPHIVTIYEFGTSDVDGRSIHFIAMEYLEGVSLRQVIESRSASPKRLLALLIQIADALGKAHARGIVHRDLKPANIMVTPDGYAKVVDFGLAKLIDPGDSDGASNVPTASFTRQGALVGTVGYMAPEQLEQHAGDQRADIFSFGCILYEAITGARAFQGETAVDVLHKILHENPPPITEATAAAPPALNRIVERCLEKRPEDRYDSMKDVVFDLREVERQLSSGSGGEGLVWRRRHPRSRMIDWRVAAGVVAVLVVAVAAAVAWRMARQSPAPLLRALVTWPSDEYDCNISPDGQWISFISLRGGTPAIFLRRRDGGEPMMLVDRPSQIGSHVWSPASDQIAYLSVSEGKPYLQIVPAFGGPSGQSAALPEEFRNGRTVRWVGAHIYLEADGLSRFEIGTRRVAKLLEAKAEKGRRSWFHVRRDGKRIAFQLSEGKRSSIWTADPDGKGAQRLTDPDATFSDYAPRFGGARDQQLLFSSNRTGQVDLWRRSLRTRATEQVTFSPAVEWVEDVSLDGRSIAYLESRRASNLWLVETGSGAARQVTADALQDRWPSTAAANRVAFQRTKPSIQGGSDLLDGDIVVADLRGAELRNERVAVSGAGLPLLSPDGRRIAYARGGTNRVYEFWVKDLSTEHQMRISNAFRIPALYSFPSDWLESNAVWSPSGRDVFVVTRTGGRYGILAADAAGRTRTIVAAAPGLAFRDLHVSPDGASLSFVRQSGTESIRSELIVHDLASGRESSLFSLEHDWRRRVYARGWTGSGDLLVLVADVNADFTESVSARRIGPGGEQRVTKIAPRAFGGASAFDRATDSLLLVAVDDDGFHNIDVVPLDGGTSRRLTNNRLPGVSFAAFEILAGNEVLLSRQERNNDLWLIDFGH